MPNFCLPHKRAKVVDCMTFHESTRPLPSSILLLALRPFRLEAATPRSRPRTAGIGADSPPFGGWTGERWAMKFFTGLAVSAALICTAGAANAQMAGGMRSVSDFDAPYAGGPPPGLVPVPEDPLPPAPRYYDRGYDGPGRGYDRGYYNPDYRSGYQDYRYQPEQRSYGP